jgi:hypothetical protein
MTTNNLFTHKSPSLVHDYKVVKNFKSMAKASYTLFDRKPEIWPTFEDHLIKEAANPTIGWSKDILGFKIMGKGPEINLMESYFDIPKHMIYGLIDELINSKREDINNINSKLYKLNALKTKLRSCLTPTFGYGIEEYMPEEDRIFFILIISRTFPDKEANKGIIRNYIMELEINQIQIYGIVLTRYPETPETVRNHQGHIMEEITNTIIKQYLKSIKWPSKLSDHEYSHGIKGR